MAAPGADVRRRVAETIAAKPGIHLREIQRTVGISLSGISHYVHALEREGAIVGVSDRHYRRFFASSLVLPQEARRLNDADRRLIAECRRPMSLAIVLNLAADGGMSQKELAERLRISKGTVSYHMARLVEMGVVNITAASGGERWALADPPRFIALLVTFADTLRDHVDRFARLWLSFPR